MPHGIYPKGLADKFIPCAGEKYQPSNGTEGTIFMDSFCSNCAKDKALNGEKDIDDCSDDDFCKIIGDTMAYNPCDPEYPAEWQYGKDGQPCCTAFTLAGEPIPEPRCEHTADMFGNQP